MARLNVPARVSLLTAAHKAATVHGGLGTPRGAGDTSTLFKDDKPVREPGSSLPERAAPDKSVPSSRTTGAKATSSAGNRLMPRETKAFLLRRNAALGTAAVAVSEQQQVKTVNKVSPSSSVKKVASSRATAGSKVNKKSSDAKENSSAGSSLMPRATKAFLLRMNAAISDAAAFHQQQVKTVTKVKPSPPTAKKVMSARATVGSKDKMGSSQQSSKASSTEKVTKVDSGVTKVVDRSKGTKAVVKPRVAAAPKPAPRAAAVKSPRKPAVPTRAELAKKPEASRKKTVSAKPAAAASRKQPVPAVKSAQVSVKEQATKTPVRVARGVQAKGKAASGLKSILKVAAPKSSSSRKGNVKAKKVRHVKFVEEYSICYIDASTSSDEEREDEDDNDQSSIDAAAADKTDKILQADPEKQSNRSRMFRYPGREVGPNGEEWDPVTLQSTFMARFGSVQRYYSRIVEHSKMKVGGNSRLTYKPPVAYGRADWQVRLTAMGFVNAQDVCPPCLDRDASAPRKACLSCCDFSLGADRPWICPRIPAKPRLPRMTPAVWPEGWEDWDEALLEDWVMHRMY